METEQYDYHSRSQHCLRPSRRFMSLVNRKCRNSLSKEKTSKREVLTNIHNHSYQQDFSRILQKTEDKYEKLNISLRQRSLLDISCDRYPDEPQTLETVREGHPDMQLFRILDNSPKHKESRAGKLSLPSSCKQSTKQIIQFPDDEYARLDNMLNVAIQDLKAQKEAEKRMNSSKRASLRDLHSKRTQSSPKRLHVVVPPNSQKQKKKPKTVYLKENFLSMFILIIGIFFIWLLL